MRWYYTVDQSGCVCPCCCRLISVYTYATCPMHALSMLELRGGSDHARAICFTRTVPFIRHLWKLAKLHKTNNILVPQHKRIQSGHLMKNDNREQEKSVENLLYVLVSSNKACWVADASVYMSMFVIYAEIVHVRCYGGWNVETG